MTIQAGAINAQNSQRTLTGCWVRQATKLLQYFNSKFSFLDSSTKMNSCFFPVGRDVPCNVAGGLRRSTRLAGAPRGTASFPFLSEGPCDRHVGSHPPQRLKRWNRPVSPMWGNPEWPPPQLSAEWIFFQF